MQAEQIITATQRWISDVVIGCNFCPFASREVERNSIHYHVEESNNKAACIATLIRECERLDSDNAIETTFIILPFAVPLFDSYLKLISASEKRMKRQDYEGIYQIASFHPDYRFSGASANDAANYTNRSPFPMMQLLREASITKALAHYGDNAQSIPERNIAFARKKGLAFMKETLALSSSFPDDDAVKKQ